MVDTHGKIMDMVYKYVPMFSGERSPKLAKEVFRFLSCCKDLHDRLEPAERSIFIKCIKYRLSDDAYYLIASQEPKDFESLQQAIKSAYMPRKSFSELRTEMLACRQRPGEDIREFADRMKELLDQIKAAVSAKYPNRDGGLIAELEVDAVATFKVGVGNLETRVYLTGRKFKTLGEVREEALYYEKDSERLQAVAPGAWKNAPEFPRGMNPEGWRTGNLNESKQRQPQRPFESIQRPAKLGMNWETPARTSQQPRSIRCFKCGQSGHIARVCQQEQQPSYYTKSQDYGHEASDQRTHHVRLADSMDRVEREYYIGREGLYCQFCRTHDHNAANCLKKYLAEKASEKLEAQKNFVITVESDIGLGGKLKLLVDTGSTCNIIKVSRIKGSTPIQTQRKINIAGLFGSARSSIGTCEAKLQIDNSEQACEFNTIYDTDSIPADGVLGMDFLKDKAIVDCINKKIWIQDAGARREKNAGFISATACTEKDSIIYSKEIFIQPRMDDVSLITSEYPAPSTDFENSKCNVASIEQNRVCHVTDSEKPYLRQLWETSLTGALYKSPDQDMGDQKLTDKETTEGGRGQDIDYGCDINRPMDGRAFVRIANARIHPVRLKNFRYHRTKQGKYSVYHRKKSNFTQHQWQPRENWFRGKLNPQKYYAKTDKVQGLRNMAVRYAKKSEQFPATYNIIQDINF